MAKSDILGCECVNGGNNPSFEELDAVTKDVQKYVNEKLDPYASIVIRQGCVKLVREEVVIPTEIPD